MNKIKNSITSPLSNIHSKMSTIMKNNKLLAGYFLLLVFIILVIFIIMYVNKQISKKSSNNTNMKDDLSYVENYISNINANDAQYHHNLRDYYIMSSYNSCCNGDFQNGYVSTDALKQVLKRGARVIDFEIYSVENKTVIAASPSNNYYQKGTYNSIPFGEAINIVENYAFSASTAPNFNDPLILHFRIKSENAHVFNDMGKILSKSFAGKRLPSKYNYESEGENIGAEPLKNFMGKVIIVVDSSNKYYKNSKLDELVNFTSGSLFLQGLRDYDVRFTPSASELIHSNKKNMSITMPDLNKGDQNMDPAIHFKMGCQMVCMNFQNVDSHLIYYLEEFNNQGSAFILKPASLRYIPIVAKTPETQDPKLSYAPRELKKPYFKHTI